MLPGAHQPIWTRAYTLLCGAVFLAFAQYALLLPAIALYVTERGGSGVLAGLVLLAFSIPSFSVRPLVGQWADSGRAVLVLTLGTLLLGAGCLLYLIPSLAMLFVASAVRGFGWAGLNTGGYTLLARSAPPERRGEASGYYTSVQGTASIAFPALGLWLIDRGGGFQSVFVVAAALAFAAFGVGRLIPRDIERAAATAHGGASPRIALSALLDRGVLLATGLQLCSTLAYPAVAAFLPLYARSQGIGNIGWYYVVSGVAGLLIRPVLGRLSDRAGRGASMAAGFGLQIAGFALLLPAHGLGTIIGAGVLIAIGSAMNNAAAVALAMDLADPARLGTAMATFSMAFQIGNGFGALLAGALVDSAGYRGMYVGAMTLVAAGLALTAVNWGSLERTHRLGLAATGNTQSSGLPADGADG